MSVIVVSNPTAGQRAGDWVVQVNGRTVSRHRKKSTAMKKARQEAKRRGDVLKKQNRNGRIRTVRSYR